VCDVLQTPHGLEPVMRIETLEARGPYHMIVEGGAYGSPGQLQPEQSTPKLLER